MKKINLQKLKRDERKNLRDYEAFGERLFLKALKEQAESYQEFRPDIMQDAYIQFYERVFVNSARIGLKLVRTTNRKAIIPEAFFLATWRAWIRDYVVNSIVIQELITNVNSRTLREIAEALALGIQDGLPFSELQRSIVKLVGSKSRARGIAVTEATRANALGKERSAEDWERETGAELWKGWLHSGNPREPRLNHLALDEKFVRKPDLFPNGLMRPGDPNGAASETVRCQCSIIYVSRDYMEEYFPNQL